jgi:hypothetical protein
VDEFAKLTESLSKDVNMFDLFPTLTGEQQDSLGGYSPYMNYGQGYNQKVEVTINTGVGDPEAIARAVEDIFNQSSYRGTSTNRNTGLYIT